MKKVPVSLIIDDSAPLVSVFYHHASAKKQTRDGRPLQPIFPNSLLLDFCEVMERHGIKGKFSIVPMPGNQGDIVRGLKGVTKEELDEWMEIVKTRVVPNFTVGPEMLTHDNAINLEDGSEYDLHEDDWAATQNRATLTPYIAKAVSLVKEAGFKVFGATSPWAFGLPVEDQYYAALSQAVYDVTGEKNSWVFLRDLENKPNAKPWVAHEEDGRTLVAIPSTAPDISWPTLRNPDTSEEFVNRMVDTLITADGKGGAFVRILETGGWPILLSHWQGLLSNGEGTGLRILDEAARRINEHFSDRVEWMSFEEMMNIVLADKAAFPKPDFD